MTETRLPRGPAEPPRLEVLKALGDNTRYAIYTEIVRSARALSTADIAEALGLHANTVRPHLERMRDVGLLEVEIEGKGSVGRPQHRYSPAPGAPSLGLEPGGYPLLVGLLANVAAASVPPADEVASVGSRHGRVLAEAKGSEPGARGGCTHGLAEAMTELGFDPAVSTSGRNSTVSFQKCPYRTLAEAFPELICQLHRGMVEGFVNTKGGSDVVEFATLEDRDPCRVELVSN